MNYKMQPCITILLSLFLFSSLLVFGQVNKRQTQLQLLGDWHWIKSDFLNRTDIKVIAPAAINEIVKINFNYNHIKKYFNDSLLWDITYYLDEYKPGSDSNLVLIHSNDVNGEVQFRNDTLMIGPFGNCGQTQYFKRNSSR